jgi:putative redox protein
LSVSKAYLKHIKGITFAGKANSNHWVTIDGPEKVGGSSAGNTPKELLLMGLAGCTASDVISILQKKRAKVDDFEVNVSADLTEEHPKVFTNVDLEYVFYGANIEAKDVERAIELSQTKYCGISAMLRKAMEINHNYRIVKPK